MDETWLSIILSVFRRGSAKVIRHRVRVWRTDNTRAYSINNNNNNNTYAFLYGTTCETREVKKREKIMAKERITATGNEKRVYGVHCCVRALVSVRGALPPLAGVVAGCTVVVEWRRLAGGRREGWGKGATVGEGGVGGRKRGQRCLRPRFWFVRAAQKGGAIGAHKAAAG